MNRKNNEVGSGMSGPFEDAFEAAFDSGAAAKMRARAEALRRLCVVAVNWKGTQQEKA